MTKLDEAIEKYKEEGETCMAFQVPEIFNAAQSYAALLKLAPEIGKLVEAGERIKDLVLCGEWEQDQADSEFLSLADDMHPTLKAIHDNLTTFGKDTIHEQKRSHDSRNNQK